MIQGVIVASFWMTFFRFITNFVKHHNQGLKPTGVEDFHIHTEDNETPFSNKVHYS